MHASLNEIRTTYQHFYRFEGPFLSWESPDVNRTALESKELRTNFLDDEALSSQR